RIEPVREWIKCIDESVTAPGMGAVVLFHVLEHTQSWLRQEGKGTARCAGHYCSIDRPGLRRAAPHHVSVYRIGSRDAPKIVAVIGKVFVQFQAEPAMNFRCCDGILEVIHVA